VAPFGPHWLSGTTPVLVVELNAPITAVGVDSVVGSITSIPPSHWLDPVENGAQPDGTLICGIDT